MIRFPLLLAAALALNGAAAIADPPAAPSGMKWVSIPEFSDEFNTSALDRNKWQLRNVHGWVGRPPTRYTPDNVSIEDGALILRTTSRVQRYEDVGDLQKDPWIDSAVVASTKLALYGYYEARIRIAALSTVSAFWMKGATTEIDIQEGVGASEAIRSAPYTMHSSTHYFPNNAKVAIAADYTTKYTTASMPVTQWHTYGVWWKDAQTVWFYLDGEKVDEQTPATAFTEPMTMYFDTEWFARYGLPNLTDMADREKNGMRVDWVHSYRLVPQ